MSFPQSSEVCHIPCLTPGSACNGAQTYSNPYEPVSVPGYTTDAMPSTADGTNEGDWFLERQQDPSRFEGFLNAPMTRSSSCSSDSLQIIIDPETDDSASSSIGNGGGPPATLPQAGPHNRRATSDSGLKSSSSEKEYNLRYCTSEPLPNSVRTGSGRPTTTVDRSLWRSPPQPSKHSPKRSFTKPLPSRYHNKLNSFLKNETLYEKEPFQTGPSVDYLFGRTEKQCPECEKEKTQRRSGGSSSSSRGGRDTEKESSQHSKRSTRCADDSAMSFSANTAEETTTMDLSADVHPSKEFLETEIDYCTMWVGNFDSTVTFHDVQLLFQDKHVLYIEYRLPKRHAYITYRSRGAMLYAVRKFNNLVFRGIYLCCIPVQFMAPPSYSARQESTESAESNMRALEKASSFQAADSLSYETPIWNYYGVDDGSSSFFKRFRPAFGHGLPVLACEGPDAWKRKVHYVILRLRSQRDLQESTETGYWRVKRKQRDALNQLYETSAQVYIIFTLNGSHELQGYARMESPVIDLISRHMPSNKHVLAGTPFEGLNAGQKDGATENHAVDKKQSDCAAAGKKLNLRYWRHVMRLRWMSAKRSSPGNTTVLRLDVCDKETEELRELDEETGKSLIEIINDGHME